MSAAVIPGPAARRTETPNAVMTTLASPTLGAARELALWRVSMEAGASGPEHVFDSEQVWTVVAGTARVSVDGTGHALSAGDTIVLPAGAPRQIVAVEALEAFVTGRAGARVTAAGHDRVTPPWIA